MNNDVKHPWLVMVGPLLGAFTGLFSETALNIALPQLARSFEIETSTLQWLVTGYMLIIGIILPLSSLLTKWFSIRELVTVSLGSFLIGSVISACASSFGFLIVGRLIQGVGTGIVLPLVFTIMIDVFPIDKRGAAVGVGSFVIMLAPILGPTLTGFVLAKLSWHWIFLLFVPIIIIAILFDFCCLINLKKLSRPRIDILSVLTSALGFGLIIIGFSLASNLGWSSPFVIGSLIIGVLVLTYYVYRQLHSKHPILNLHVLRKQKFSRGSLLVMIDFAIVIATMYIMPQFLQRGMAIPVALTGMIMLPGGIVNSVVSTISGRLFDRYGARPMTIIGFIIVIVGALLMLRITLNSSVSFVILTNVILTFGCSLAMTPAQTHALNALEPTENADGSTIINTFQQIIGAVATAIATSLLGLGMSISHTTNKHIAFAKGSHFGFCFIVILALIGLIVAFTLKSERRSKDLPID